MLARAASLSRLDRYEVEVKTAPNRDNEDEGPEQAYYAGGNGAGQPTKADAEQEAIRSYAVNPGSEKNQDEAHPVANPVPSPLHRGKGVYHRDSSRAKSVTGGYSLVDSLIE